ncbi:MAG: hypothetical protein ABI665_25905 [Vicinamibacterales bacterium]
MAISLVLWVADVPRVGAGLPEPRPLPEATPFLAAARARIIAGEEAYVRFVHKERSTQVRFSPFARKGSGPPLLLEVFPSADDELTYRRVIERNGKPVTDVLEQDRKFRARFEARQRQLSGESTASRTARLDAEEKARARLEVALRDSLALFTFSIDSRTTWEDEPAILVKFVPRPDGQPQTREGRIVKSFAGRAWVHESDHELMHLEAEAIDDVSIGFGLIGRLNKGATVQFTRRPFRGTWLPSLTVFNGSGRVLLRPMDVAFRREYFDYDPYDPADLPARLGWTR